MFTKAYSSFVEFLLYLLKAKSDTAEFSSDKGRALYYQRLTALEDLRKSAKGWKKIKDKIETHRQKTDQAMRVLKPDINKAIFSCVETYINSHAYKTRVEEFSHIWETCKESNTKPTVAEYNKLVALPSTLVNIMNGSRKGVAGSILNVDFGYAEPQELVNIMSMAFYCFTDVTSGFG